MTTENVMSTDGIIEKKQNINQLLSADTYQGMSDEDIDRIIEYRINTAVTQAVNEQTFEEYEKKHQELCERIEQRSDEAHERFKQLLNTRVSFITVDPETGLAVSNEQA